MNNLIMKFVILEAIGLILLVLGYLIKAKGMIHLISGVSKNDERIKDKHGYSRFVGGNALILGALICCGGLVIYFKPDYEKMIEPIILIGVLVLIVSHYFATKKYTK